MSSSEMITVFLPRYNFQQQYNIKEFTSLFPDSVITRTYELTHETDVPLDNSIVTPEILKLLEYILVNKDYPYMDSSMERVLDYLGIDLPSFIFDSQYEQLKIDYPEIRLFNLGNLDENYNQLLQMSIDYELPLLALYVIKNTNQEKHRNDNTKFVLDELNNPVHSDTVEEIMEAMIDNISMSEDNVQIYIDDGIRRGYLNFLRLFLDKHGRNYIPNPNYIFDLISDMGKDPEHYQSYVDMINYLAGYIRNPRGSVSYNIFQDIISGRGLRYNPGNLEEFPGLLWIASLSNQEASFISILNNLTHQEVSYLIESKLVTTLKDNRQTIRDFLLSYVAHPNLINPRLLRLTGEALVTYGDRETITTAIDLLSKDHPELADILRAL